MRSPTQSNSRVASLLRCVGAVILAIGTVGSSGCVWSVHKQGPLGASSSLDGIEARLRAETKQPEVELNPTTAADAPPVRIYSTLRVRNTKAGLTFGPPTLQVATTAAPFSLSDFKGANLPLQATQPDASGWYNIPLRAVQGNIDNQRLVRVVVPRKQGATTVDSAVYYLTYVKRWRWFNGITAPVLYRVNGNAGGFALANFAPSVAFGPRTFFGGGAHQFVGFNGMVTVYQSTETQQRPFSLGLGGILDIGGWVQAGMNYQFKDRRGYFVLGVRPEVWAPKK
jgi:hypothetical protein